MSAGPKPCPFCGGEAHLAADYSSEQDKTMWNVWHECNGFEGESSGYGYSPHPWFETPWYENKHKAVEAWNRRADDTCKDVGKGATFKCSECGCELDIWVDNRPSLWLDDEPMAPFYCPYCGRRIEFERQLK